MNLDLDMDAAERLCAQHGIAISTMEPLDSGGTRIVLMTNEGAGSLHRLAQKQLIDGPVVRSGVYQAKPPIPYS